MTPEILNEVISRAVQDCTFIILLVILSGNYTYINLYSTVLDIHILLYNLTEFCISPAVEFVYFIPFHSITIIV